MESRCTGPVLNLRSLKLELDPDDWATIQEELAKHPDWTNLPDGDSNLAGAILAESIRDLNEYRTLWEAEHPVG